VTQEKDFVGPARPAIGAEYSDSSSSEDEDGDNEALKNDPIFMQA